MFKIGDKVKVKDIQSPSGRYLHPYLGETGTIVAETYSMLVIKLNKNEKIIVFPDEIESAREFTMTIKRRF